MAIRLTSLDTRAVANEEEGTYNLPDQERVVFGRASRRRGCDITLRDANISYFHCEINHFDNVYTVNDLCSTNGTYVNGLRIVNETTLRDGDILNLAKVRRYKVRISQD